MGKYSGILLCSDFDGTLSVSEKISKENMDAIRYFRQNGGLFTVASGRYHDYLLPFFKEYSFGVPLITINGAVFYDVEKKKIVRERFVTGLTKDYINKLLDNIEGIDHILFFTEHGIEKICYSTRERLDEIDLNSVYKLVLRVENDIEISDRVAREARSITPDHLEVVRSWYRGIEIQNREHMKGSATRLLARTIGADKLVCVGDFENDIDMVREADIGYAVGNAIDGLKAVADRITVPVDEHAIAKIIGEL